MKTLYVYIMASKSGTLYVGVTSDLPARVWQHREGVVEGFTSDHDVKKLVWCQPFEDIVDAITYEKKIKKWRRDWKRSLIEEANPHWADLYPGL